MAVTDGASVNSRQPPTSAYHERIQKLSERLSGLQTGLDTERNTRYDALDKRVESVDQRLQTAQDSVTKKFKSVQDQVSVLSKEIDEDKKLREDIHAAKEKDLTAIEGKYVLHIVS